jgi:hypothetical protein
MNSRNIAGSGKGQDSNLKKNYQIGMDNNMNHEHLTQ